MRPRSWCAVVLLVVLAALVAPAAASAVSVGGLSEDRAFSPDGDGYEDSTYVSYYLDEKSRVSIVIRDSAGVAVRTIESEVPHDPGWTGFAWDGLADGGDTLPDGVYDYSVSAETLAGDHASATGRLAIDTAPVASLTSPTSGEKVSDTTNATVIAAPGRTLSSVSLYGCTSPAGWPSCYFTYGLGAALAPDVAGSWTVAWDTSVTPAAVYDLYALVTYTDGLGAAHQYATASVSPVTVQRAPTITSQSADRAFSPDGDGQGDSANVSFSLTAPASVTIAILDGDGTPVRQLETDAGRPEGSNSFEWDGRDDSGAIVADGEYAYTIRAEGSIGDPVTAEGRIGVDTAAIASLTKPTPNAELSGTVPVTVSPAAGRTLTSAYFYACEDEWWCYSSQWIGYSTVQEADGGLTALWDTEGARAAEYLLYAQVTFEDDFGETHVYALPATRVSVTRSADVAISSPDRAFSPDGDGQEDETYVYYSLTAPARVTVEIRTEGGSPVRTVRSAADEGEGWQWFAWDGRDENGRVVADGSYRYVVRVESGDSDAVEREGSIAVDTAPVATLVAPEVDASVHGTTPVRVEPAPGRTLEDGRLYRCVSSGADNCWSTTEVAYLWGPGFDGSLESTWDTAHSPAGTVGLEAWVTYADTFGERHTVRVARRDVTVVRAAEVVDLGPDRAFSPNGDSDEDTGGLSFRLTAPASTSVTIADSEGEEVRALLVDEDLGEGTHYVEWDGRDEAGDVVADGTYEYTISALSADRTADSKKGHVGVDTAAVATLSRPAAGDRLSGTTRLVASPAAGRTLERADFYTCDGFGGSECWWLTGLGSSLVTDFDGSIGIDWDTRTSATGGRNLLAVVEWKDTFGSTHYTRTPVVSVDVTRSVGVRKLTGDRYMTPNGDGSEDEGVVSYALTTPASVTITVRTGGGALVRTLASAAARPEGSNNATWDGLDDDGQPVPDGSYQYTIVARGAEGDPAQVSGRIGVQRAAPGRIRRPEADDTLSADAPFSFEPASGVTTLSVRGCVIDRCATIGAAASDNSWRATLDVRGLATGPASVTAEIVWRDGFGARHVTSLSRAVTVDNTAPALDFDVTPSSGLAPLASAASFTTSMSSGRPLSYTVDFGDATAVETGTVAAPYERVSLDHLYARAGTYRTRVSVTDGAGHHAQRSRYVTVTEPPNRRPSADLSVTPSSGSAPLDVAAGISAADADGDSLTYRLDWGDGSVASGPVPRGDVPHRYARPGTYLARLAVSDGALDRVVSRRIVVVLPEPLHAHAGEDIVTIAGEGVHLDGAGSRPSELIDGYTWSLGDGSTASGRAVDHVYTAPGTYSAKLTVEVGGDQHSDTLEVTVLERSVAPRVTAHVRSGGAPLPGADVLVVDADGTRVAAVADESGEATLSLPDGDHTVFASRDGYRPRGEPVHVAGGRGEVTLDLEAGEAVSTSLTSERLDIEQIKALGIDPEDPANQHVFEFEAHLAFEEDAPPEVELRGYTVGGSDGEGEPWKWEYYAHDAWQPCAADCSIPVQGGTAYPTVHYTEGIPTLQWLIIPFRASFLKEFFSVQMLVQNLAGPGVTLSHGAASLELPEGLTLAPTADPQSVTQALEDIPSGGSRSVTWTVRGDDEGEYQPTATFSGTLEPIGRPVSYRAVTAKPFKVWAGSALKLIVEPESRVDRLRPYRVRVGLKNVSDVPVYNPAIELLRDGRLNYIEQPRERLRQGAAAVDPGDTFWTDEFVLVPKITGRLRPRYSFVKKTAGDVSLESSIAPVAQRPVGSIEVRPNKGRVVLDWQPVAGADSYQVFRTPNLDTDFPADPVPNVRFLGPTKAVVSNVDPAAAAQLYAVSSVRNGRNVLAHPVVSAESTNTWQSPTARVRYSAPCGSDRADIELVFDDPDFDLRDYHVEVNGVTRTGRASGHHHVVTVPDVPITESGTEVKAWASNTETAQGDHGPPTAKTLRPCRYVALGDSFSSGEGVPQFEDGTATDDNGIFDGGDATNKCHRSPRAYGRLVAVPDALKKNMEFVACSGAKIGDLLEGNQGGYTYKGNPEGPQINHLDGGVRLATMTIGGNDAYFADVLKQCVLERLGTYFLGRGPEGLVPSTPFPFTITCRSDWDERVATEIQALRKSLPDTYRRLRAEMAPGGRLLVLTYPEIFPRKPQYCWGIRSGDVQWISSAQRQANDVIKEAAHEAGVEVVDLGDRFEGHDVCDVLGDTWFNGPTFEAALHGGNAEHSFHPNRRGQEEMANAVNAYLAGPQPGSDYLVRQGDTLDTTRTVAADQSAVTFSTHWPGSDVQMEIETPSGEILGRGTERGGLVHDLGPTYETYTLERPEPGIYKIHLTGLDVAADGEETRLSFNQVPERNVPPSPLYTASAGHGPPPELSVRFDAAKAYDLDGEITGYEWDFGDGASASGATATHVYRGTGSYQPKLTVTDNEGKSASYGAEPIVVTTPPEARDDIATTEGGEPLELASPGVLANDRDKEGGTLTAFLVTGPAHGTATLDANGKLRYVAADGFAGRDQLSYRVIDSHGEPSGIATVELRVAPDTILDSGPAGLTADATPTFGFRSTRATGFECRVDAGAWQACSSPKTSEALSEGAHSFDVRAKSSGGDVDPTPAARSLKVDTVAPSAVITSGTSGPSRSRSAEFAFSSEDGARFDCRLGTGEWAACGSPARYTDLAEQEYTFRVRARDAAGNVSPQPPTRTFTVDLKAPTTTISSGPAGVTSDARPEFAFVSEPGATFECRVDAGAFVACESPFSTAALQDGQHTFAVRATDAAGNVASAPAERAFALDTVAPKVEIDSGPDGATKEPAPEFGFKSHEVGAELECRVDAAAFAACTSPIRVAALPDGAHTFAVRGRDIAGNVSVEPATRSFSIDTTAPQTTIVSGPVAAYSGVTAAFDFIADDPAATFECRLTAAFAACASPFVSAPLPAGSYTFAVRAKDALGNLEATPASQSVTVTDRPPPDPPGGGGSGGTGGGGSGGTGGGGSGETGGGGSGETGGGGSGETGGGGSGETGGAAGGGRDGGTGGGGPGGTPGAGGDGATARAPTFAGRPGKTARVDSKGRFRSGLRVDCPLTGPACTVVVTIRRAAGRRASLGRAAITLAPGRRQLVSGRLTAAGLKLARARRGLRARVMVQATAGGVAAQRSFSLTLRR